MWEVSKTYESEDKESKKLSSVYQNKEDAMKDFETTSQLLECVCGPQLGNGPYKCDKGEVRSYYNACYVTISILEV